MQTKTIKMILALLMTIVQGAHIEVVMLPEH